MLEADKRCQEYFQGQYAQYCRHYSAADALNECLHDFLDQRPQGKYSARNRAAGLVAAHFWWAQDSVAGAELVSQAIARVLHFDDVMSTELLDHLAAHHADQLRWAIRYAKLFTRVDSQLWRHLQESLSSAEWMEFFGVCRRLLQQLEPFDEAIVQAERRLKSLSLLELLSYLSVLAYRRLAEVDTEIASRDWSVYERVILRRLEVSGESDFRLSEEVLGRSLRRHLSPMLFPQPGEGRECLTNLETVADLVAAMRERIDYEGSIDWFCFDEECLYQLKPGQSVIFNKTDEGTLRWQRTERKSQLLWCYWMQRAVDLFAASGRAGQIIGSPENHEANQLAYIKAMRSQLYLQVVFGIGEQVRLNNGAEVQLKHAMLASELTMAFFEQAYLQPYHQYLAERSSPLAALGRLAFDGLLQGENRFPMTWSEQPAKVQRIRGWTVSDKHPSGDVEAAKAILQFWTSDLQALSDQIKQTPNIPTPRLYERPFYKIGRFSFQFPWVAGRQNSLTAAVNNLRRVEGRRAELRSETERVEHELADSLRRRGFTVLVGFQPPKSDELDAGEVDVLAHLDGVLLLLEVKSGFIRSSRHEVWLHRTNTLRKAARQLKCKQPAVLRALQMDPDLRSRLGIAEFDSIQALNAWVVDTSIELDGEAIDGFRVVSREVMEVALRDERHYLGPFDQEEEPGSLYPYGFSAQAFMQVIEGNEIWQGVL
ncbi:NERD domain-containing protein [Aquipseudomonas alcaligenes]|uniref:NERD domain-containing protein n=1 Tax=Aquipseudomonas alcaligenes TaxID=43263 RepID=UPI0037483134